MMPILRSHLAGHSAAELSAVFEKNELPFAPITKPQDLFDDPHLNATGGLAPIRMNDGSTSKVPLMPFTLGGERPGIRLQPPLLGEHTSALLQGSRLQRRGDRRAQGAEASPPETEAGPSQAGPRAGRGCCPPVSWNQAAFSEPRTQTCPMVFRPGRS